MARTLLLRALRQLAADFQIAEERGISPEEVRAARTLAATRLSRRSFLAASAGAGAAGLLPNPGPVTAAPAGRAVIVGGGISGLTAALTLADAGVRPQIFEASDRIGGRMYSNSPVIPGNGAYWDNGQVTEWCGELIDSGHKTMLGLARRFRLAVDNLHAAEPPHSTETYQFGSAYYTEQQALADFRRLYPALRQDLQAAGYPTTYARSTPAGVALDGMSVYQWIESRVAGGHRSALGQLLDTAYAIEYGQDAEDQSALNLIYLLAYQPDRRHFSVFGLSDEKYHIRGGNQRLPLAMAAALPAGAYHTGQRLTRIVANADRTVTLTFLTSAGENMVTADRVILTLPFAVLRTLDLASAGFDAQKLKVIQEMGTGKNTKLMLQFRERLWNKRGPWGVSNGSTYSNQPYQASWEATRAQPGAGGIQVAYSGGTNAEQYPQPAPYTTAQELLTSTSATQTVQQLDVVFPGLASRYHGKANLSQPFKDPNFNCSYSYWRVGQYHTLAGYEKVPQGSIHFAGEHCSQDFQGFMEGAATEGVRAGREVLKALKSAR